MSSLNEILDNIIRREGGYVDDPSDSGWATNYGITRATLEEWRGALQRKQDVQELEEWEARKIYTKFYYENGKVASAPDSLRDALMDACVNHGVKTAWKLLQRAANEQGCCLVVDGVAGMKTIAALNTCGEKKLLADYIRERGIKYDAIAAHNPTQKKFLKGWHNRLKDFA
jgi:lysozyme family protein